MSSLCSSRQTRAAAARATTQPTRESGTSIDGDFRHGRARAGRGVAGGRGIGAGRARDDDDDDDVVLPRATAPRAAAVSCRGSAGSHAILACDRIFTKRAVAAGSMVSVGMVVSKRIRKACRRC